MPSYVARAEWKGGLGEGPGKMRVGSSAFETAMAAKTRQGEVTNPEEVVGAALAGCYSLMLTKTIQDADHLPGTIKTAAAVDLQEGDDGVGIPRITLNVDVELESEGLDEQELQKLAEKANRNCPVSKALAGPEITVKATLKQPEKYQN